jgi:hypothetical protein
MPWFLGQRGHEASSSCSVDFLSRLAHAGSRSLQKSQGDKLDFSWDLGLLALNYLPIGVLITTVDDRPVSCSRKISRSIPGKDLYIMFFI